jgi:hypothetical protein
MGMAIVLALGFLLTYAKSRRKPPPADATQVSVSPVPSENEASEAHRLKSGNPTPASRPPVPRSAGKIVRETRRVPEFAPTPEEYAADVDRNPHRPPASLNRFAVALAGRFDDAVAHPEKAEGFFAELRDCVESAPARTTRAIRGLCLFSAKRLGDKVPALRERIEEYWNRADPSLKRLSDIGIVQPKDR